MKILLFGEVIMELDDLQIIVKKGACDIEYKNKGWRGYQKIRYQGTPGCRIYQTSDETMRGGGLLVN